MSKSPHQERQAHRVPPYRRPLVVGGILLIVAVIGIITAVVCKSFLSSDHDSDHSSKPPQESSDNSSTPQPSPDHPDGEAPLENKAPQYEGEDPNTLDELTGNIAYQDIDQDAQTLRVAVMINQYLQADGQCILNIKRGDTIMRTASALAVPDVTSSTCGSLETSIAGLSPGTYQLEIILTGDNKKGIISGQLEI